MISTDEEEGERSSASEASDDNYEAPLGSQKVSSTNLVCVSVRDADVTSSSCVCPSTPVLL